MLEDDGRVEVHCDSGLHSDLVRCTVTECHGISKLHARKCRKFRRSLLVLAFEAKCSGHLGHIFDPDDGAKRTNQRHCAL